ncbi:peptidase, M23/M37 family [Nitratiruptor sp. YY08-26]|uniref:M23 family metallopeptidase n=1 Tax=unclassified Nitratiruptor TaxID=2624044 RepID=UPI0019350E98|nr:MULTISPECIES: M23 family metallopeptidase [unclassified Nitratiruptor]BCD61604.1 peptidase, M23/M37 family [Nitratiruptor sp. YY08-13]BCD65538.1 peptidase, M23/M37 family [Nitratiruptor sp. YY08-26]
MRRSKKGLYLFIAVVAIMGGVAYFISTSKAFEREKPTIAISDKIYWNLKKPIQIKLTDNEAIKEYTVVISNGEQKKTLEKQILNTPKKEVELQLKAPADMEFPSKKAELEIEVRDRSYWNYFLGNSAKKSVKIYIDTKRPELTLISNSYAILKGGSALVVFGCKDENLKEFYIQTNFGKKFYAEPFYKKGYYAALIAWPLWKKSFRADIVAYDKAGNRAKIHIPLYLKNRRYKKSIIHLKKSFLEGKVSILAEDYPQTEGMDLIEKFKFVNETLREQNEKLIHTLTSKVPQKLLQKFVLKPFYPLKNAAPVASFGTHRYYYYHGKLVSESYHLGLDLASIKRASIKASNAGDVVFADYNGIYGNMPIISHGLGLYTLYGHCSSILVKKGEHVPRGKTIAKTGNTGLALGDHLHFGVLVQGIEVHPSEWMDKKWIKVNISDILRDAKKIIDTTR